MESKEYFEKVMQDYNQNRKGRSLRKYCKMKQWRLWGAYPVQEELSFTGETPDTIARCFHTSYHNFEDGTDAVLVVYFSWIMPVGNHILSKNTLY